MAAEEGKAFWLTDGGWVKYAWDDFLEYCRARLATCHLFTVLCVNITGEPVEFSTGVSVVCLLEG